MTTDITAVIERLYDLRTWRAFDIDDDGRVFAGWDDLGSVQLVEIDTDGSRHPLTALPGACSGRYIPGRRAVVVQHDAGGDEKMQLSTLDLTSYPEKPVDLDGLTPLVHDPAYMHNLMDVTPTSVVYDTNRRNGVDFDVVVRDLATGDETDGVRRRRLRHRERRLARPAVGRGHSAQPAAGVHPCHGDGSGGAGWRDARRHGCPTSTPSTIDAAWTGGRPGLDRRVQPRPRVHGDRPGLRSTTCAWTWLVEDDAHELTPGCHPTPRRWSWVATSTASSSWPCTRSMARRAVRLELPSERYADGRLVAGLSPDRGDRDGRGGPGQHLRGRREDRRQATLVADSRADADSGDARAARRRDRPPRSPPTTASRSRASSFPPAPDAPRRGGGCVGGVRARWPGVGRRCATSTRPSPP